jgi:hypothetical protein
VCNPPLEELAVKFKVNKSTISRLLDKYRNFKKVDDFVKTGRPKEYESEDAEEIKNCVLAGKGGSIRQIMTNTGLELSKTTI